MVTTSWAGTITMAAGAATGIYGWDFPVVGAGTPITQNISCSGSISVYDADNTAPGFLIATGNMSTFVENGQGQLLNQSGVGALRGSLNTTQLPIFIGEGRPF